MSVEDYKVTSLSAEIMGDILLELLGSEMKSLERIKLKSGDDLEEVGNIMDFGGKL